jgi:hypothetical protein
VLVVDEAKQKALLASINNDFNMFFGGDEGEEEKADLNQRKSSMISKNR